MGIRKRVAVHKLIQGSEMEKPPFGRWTFFRQKQPWMPSIYAVLLVRPPRLQRYHQIVHSAYRVCCGCQRQLALVGLKDKAGCNITNTRSSHKEEPGISSDALSLCKMVRIDEKESCMDRRGETKSLRKDEEKKRRERQQNHKEIRQGYKMKE